MQEKVYHAHCETCIKISKCTKRAVEGLSCAIISCQKKCGSSFHSCKANEHSLLCPNMQEPCINANYGCPHIVLRKHRGSHLESCPASCVPCNAEWNRWPLCTKERQIHIPFAQINPQLREEQLDVALALRDQGVLDHWMNLPRKTQKLMRCNLTPRHPAIPLILSLWEPTVKMKVKSISSDDGLSNVSTPRQSAERSDNSILSVSSTDDESPWGRRRKPPGLLQSMCAQLFNKSAAQNQQPVLVSNQDDSCFPVKNKVVDEDTLSDISNGLDDDCSTNEILDAPFGGSGNCGLLPSNPPELPLLTTLGLDLSIECIPRYQSKPKSMYTFVCAQDFRRDEFAWHYRNWHSEIHGGLDGWIEQRCPLARYGCSFARRRMFPVSPDHRIIYSSIVESFGVTRTPQDTARKHDELSLTDLPFEVLRAVASYLDGFSLCHLSVTCHLLREVARSLLYNRGLVTAHWQKSQQGWIITHYRWSFSTSFSPVERWGFESSPHISNHLRDCRYNIKSSYVFPKRVALPGFMETFASDTTEGKCSDF